MDFQIPKIVHEDADDHRGVFAIEPLDRGFGHTFGNSLRRVLLSSLEGAAVTSVKVEGTAHEFTTLPGVREDVTDIILNLKNLVARLHGESPEIEVHIAKKGPGVVTAADIEDVGWPDWAAVVHRMLSTLSWLPNSAMLCRSPVMMKLLTAYSYPLPITSAAR